MIPAIGPTASWWWQGANAISPAAAIRSAASGVSAQPSSSAAPVTPARIGPHMSS